jgi:hypothetical protein
MGRRPAVVPRLTIARYVQPLDLVALEMVDQIGRQPETLVAIREIDGRPFDVILATPSPLVRVNPGDRCAACERGRRPQRVGHLVSVGRKGDERKVDLYVSFGRSPRGLGLFESSRRNPWPNVGEANATQG